MPQKTHSSVGTASHILIDISLLPPGKLCEEVIRACNRLAGLPGAPLSRDISAMRLWLEITFKEAPRLQASKEPPEARLVQADIFEDEYPETSSLLGETKQPCLLSFKNGDFTKSAFEARGFSELYRFIQERSKECESQLLLWRELRDGKPQSRVISRGYRKNILAAK